MDLRSNRDFGELLPKEALETADAQAILAAYRSFAEAHEARALRPLNELKLIVVGNEAVGKTSLLRYLITGQARNPAEAKTPGIAQQEKIEVRGWSPQNCSVQLNVWDFGGQEMMRGTHRFFLTERSLYLLVLEDRRQDDRSIYDWLKTIRNRGGESPVIVVINKSDAGKQDLRLDETSLRASYPGIVAFLRASCDPGDWALRSIERLRTKIVETITTSEWLKHVRDPIPINWLRIKDRVRELANQRSVLPHTDFITLCREPGAGIEPIRDDNEQRALLRCLHELGTIVAHGLERDAPAALREITLLDPNWLTEAVYRILEKASLADQDGEFARSQLTGWLEANAYPPERHEFILDMMQDRDIGLCFRLPAEDERYLVPEALTANRRVYDSWPDDSLRFRYAYNYLPPGLIPRFIVQAHQSLAQGKFRWRTGVVLLVSGCDVLVTADPDQRRVDVEVKGPLPLRRAALNVVLNHLEVVHALNLEAEPIALVPLPDRADVHVRYQHLLMLEQRMGSDYRYIPDGTDRDYRVGDLLDGVRRDESRIHIMAKRLTPRRASPPSSVKPKPRRERKGAARGTRIEARRAPAARKAKAPNRLSVFISYSHRDEKLREQLGKHLSVLERQGLVAGWHDRKIDAGREWAGEIDAQLNNAEIILLLISASFINSQYCYDLEMKRALERHDNGEARVIPIILRPVSLKGTPFAKLQALPRDAKPVSNWPNRDSAFVEITEGLRKVIEDLTAPTPRTRSTKAHR